MTAQYEQDNINLRDTTPIVVTILDATPVLVSLGVITDGQTLSVSVFGGGSIPGAVSSNNYILAPGAATFGRQGGVGFVNFLPFTPGGNIQQAGAPVTLAFTHDDGPTETICQFSITVAAFPYAHNLRYSTIQF